MGLKKKKNVIIISSCMALCFILYQLYFFLTITSEVDNSRVIPVLDHDTIRNVQHLRSEEDKYINEHGMLRGVFYTKIKDYRPDSKNEFKCGTSDQQIPYEYLNDDYCDCDDGTDEPSTNACPDGIFYCQTQSKKKQKINTVLSGKVNDGICDCCDGSDEWFNDRNKLLSQSSSKYYRQYVSSCPNICDM